MSFFRSPGGLPAGRWMLTIWCSSRLRQGFTDLEFTFEPGGVYFVQCQGSWRRFRQPTAVRVDTP